MADPSQINRFVKSMQRKVEMFKKAWSSSFVSFNVENCINSTFDEKGKADMRSPSPKTPVGSRNGAYGLSPSPRTSTHVSTPQSAKSKIPVNLSTPQSWSKEKDLIVLGGPDESIGQRLGKNKMGSIVGRMKANPRKASFIPTLKSPHYVPKNKRTKVSRSNPNYCLNHAEKSCLEEFWIRLYSNCDCGIFTMANAEHVAYRRAIEYTQADICYYRQKIVTDIYQKQKQLYSYFFESQNVS
ncbi:hypothetical protein CKAN_02021700 [Cinnamomum micranthum f. kanehirae]|uniref:Uncharacterized protein n=1 Tax=Cinnamomum micranthum f. kanehirae TaxID=337451 RepID=A0A443PK03_9MAGN|nr:hypothetical protein CKAN_02021700 [Cinnamomum micranthum f. kanehirae]